MACGYHLSTHQPNSPAPLHRPHNEYVLASRNQHLSQPLRASWIRSLKSEIGHWSLYVQLHTLSGTSIFLSIVDVSFVLLYHCPAYCQLTSVLYITHTGQCEGDNENETTTCVRYVPIIRSSGIQLKHWIRLEMIIVCHVSPFYYSCWCKIDQRVYLRVSIPTL